MTWNPFSLLVPPCPAKNITKFAAEPGLSLQNRADPSKTKKNKLALPKQKKNRAGPPKNDFPLPIRYQSVTTRYQSTWYFPLPMVTMIRKCTFYRCFRIVNHFQTIVTNPLPNVTIFLPFLAISAFLLVHDFLWQLTKPDWNKENYSVFGVLNSDYQLLTTSFVNHQLLPIANQC